MLGLMQTATPEQGTTVYLAPEQIAQLTEQMQGNTYALIAWLAFILLNVSALAIMAALSGR